MSWMRSMGMLLVLVTGAIGCNEDGDSSQPSSTLNPTETSGTTDEAASPTPQALTTVSLSIGSATWRSSGPELRVLGTGTSGVTVTLRSVASGAALGTAVVSSTGRWGVSQWYPNAVPCRVRVESGGLTREAAVTSAPASCQTAQPARTLSTLAVTGPAVVDEGATAQYRATATFSDGTSSDVSGSASWTTSTAAATIAAGGLLTGAQVAANQNLMVSATYSYGGTSRTATAAVTIVDRPVVVDPPPPPPPATSGIGPRALPPTFVPLEIAQFPRPTAEACADNTRSIRVAAGQSIAAALAQATPGTTVWVAPGTYSEGLAEGTALEWGTANVCLRAENGGTVVLQAKSGQRRGMSPSGDDTVIEGFTLRGFVSSIAFWTGGGRTQRRVTIERTRVELPAGTFREGIAAYGDNRTVAGMPPTVDGLLLLDVSIEGTDLGLSCNSGPCAHWWVENSSVIGRRGAGTSGADAIACEEGRQMVFVDSVVGGADADGIDMKATDVVVFGTHVLGVARNGIKLWKGGDVIDTVVDGTGADSALAGSTAGRYRYLHVLVTHHGAPTDNQYLGTWGYDHPGPGYTIEMINSIFYRNATGGFYVPTGATVSIRNTLFDNANAKLIEIGGTRYMVSQLAAFQTAGYGANNRVADPLFSDLAGHVYTTQAGSPARDAAEPVAGLDRDCDGWVRVSGAGPDIGPAESR